jgi:hypothetical protein
MATIKSRRSPGSGGGGKRAHWSPEQLASYLKRNPAAATPDTTQALRLAAPESRTAAAEALARAGAGHRLRPEVQDAETQAAKPKRPGLRINDLIDSIAQAPLDVRVVRDSQGHLQEMVLWFAGARLLTYNQLISMFQKRLVQYFRYKKAWRKRMAKALDEIGATEGPCAFPGQVQIEVLRQSYRRVDRDGVTNLFKILIDALRHPEVGVITDDNPNVVVDVIPFQRIVRRALGEPIGVGMRLRAVAQDWKEPPVPDPVVDWLQRPPPVRSDP